MSRTARTNLNVILVLMLALWGGCAGLIGGVLSTISKPDETHLPLPHHFPQYPGGISLRLAMAHDVIHERFPRHSVAFYEERNRRVRDALNAEQADGSASPQYWELTDDLAVGIEMVGRHEEAVALMRAKLQRQEQAGVTGKDLYSSYANLGTFLILWQIHEGFNDKVKAKARISESIELIRKAVEVKPDAHFGREKWQSVLEEFLLAVLDQPELLLQFDLVGNRLDRNILPDSLRCFDIGKWTLQARDAQWHVAHGIPSQPSSQDSSAQSFRKAITRIGAEQGWTEALQTGHAEPVPFDEPTLGIIGMWRYGGGANPHFALALGETMLRVGQRYIAWTAYERAATLAAGIGPDPIPQKLIDHCRRRQQVVEAGLPPAEVARFRPRYTQELAYGIAYQQKYQDYEATRIREGMSIDDPRFYDDFLRINGPIASPIGSADQFLASPSQSLRTPTVSVPLILMGAGAFAFVGGSVLRWLGKRRAAV